MHLKSNHYKSLISHSGRHITCAKVLWRGPRHCSGNRAKGVCHQVWMQTQVYFGDKALQNTSAKVVSKQKSPGLFQQIFQPSLDHRRSPAISSCVSSSACPGSRLLLQRSHEMQPPSLHKTIYVHFPLARQGTANPGLANHRGTLEMEDPGNSTFLSRWV